MKEEVFYCRQTSIHEIGKFGQEKLKQSKVLIVGAGGIGHPLGTYLAAAGIGKLTIIDFDKVEQSNLNRQIFFHLDDIGKNKSEVLAQKLSKQNPFIEIQSIVSKLNAENAKTLIEQNDLVVDCTDNFATKFLLHDSCWALKKDLVQGSVYQFEGQIQVFNFSLENDKGCLRCLWSQIPERNCVQNCAEAGIIGSVTGSIGTLCAMEVIKLRLQLGTVRHNSTFILNLLTGEVQNLAWNKSINCVLCSHSAQIIPFVGNQYESFEEFELKDFKENKFKIIDIRESSERGPEDTNENWPLSAYEEWKEKVSSEETYLFVCQKGIRSKNLVSKLRQQGLKNCYSLIDGVRSLQ